MVFIPADRLGGNGGHSLMEGVRTYLGISDNIRKRRVREPHRLEAERPGKLNPTSFLKAHFDWAMIRVSFFPKTRFILYTEAMVYKFRR